MTNLSISQLPAASTITGTELVPIVQAGQNVKALASALSGGGSSTLNTSTLTTLHGVLYGDGTHLHSDSAITTNGTGTLTAAALQISGTNEGQEILDANGNACITFGGDGDTNITGNLHLAGDVIQDGSGNVCIQLDGSGNTQIQGNLKLIAGTMTDTAGNPNITFSGAYPGCTTIPFIFTEGIFNSDDVFNNINTATRQLIANDGLRTMVDWSGNYGSGGTGPALFGSINDENEPYMIFGDDGFSGIGCYFPFLDPSHLTSVDVLNRHLVGSNGSTVALNWSTGTMVGSGAGLTGIVPFAAVNVATSVTLTANAVHYVDTSAIRTLTFPTPTAGTIISIKDATFTAATHNITVARHASEKIENVAGSMTLNTNGGNWQFGSNGTDWFLLG